MTDDSKSAAHSANKANNTKVSSNQKDEDVIIHDVLGSAYPLSTASRSLSLMMEC